MQDDRQRQREYVGRGGLKLRHALDEFGVDPAGLTCADLGCNVGGFTDCLLQAGAVKVYAVDTGYGTLDYRLRIDPRVVVMERTNALHAEPPEGVGLAVIDLGWTPQRLAIPAALRWLAPGGLGRIITLIKPHYEASDLGRGDLLRDGVLAETDAETILAEVLERMGALGVETIGVTRSPIPGGGRKRRRPNRPGNTEWLALLRSSVEDPEHRQIAPHATE